MTALFHVPKGTIEKKPAKSARKPKKTGKG